MSATTKSRKMKPFTRRWYKMADELARRFAPEIIACVDCRHPVASGYCCENCGSGKGGLNEEGESR